MCVCSNSTTVLGSRDGCLREPSGSEPRTEHSSACNVFQDFDDCGDQSKYCSGVPIAPQFCAARFVGDDQREYYSINGDDELDNFDGLASHDSLQVGIRSFTAIGAERGYKDSPVAAYQIPYQQSTPVSRPPGQFACASGSVSSSTVNPAVGHVAILAQGLVTCVASQLTKRQDESHNKLCMVDRSLWC